MTAAYALAEIRELACHYLLLKPNKPFVIQIFSEELLRDSNFG
jgi:hypothetical protein